MKLTAIWLLLTLFRLVICELSSEEEAEEERIAEAKLKHIRILRVNTYGEALYMKVTNKIHTNSTRFDVYVMLNRELGSNYLIMNIKLRAKYMGTELYQTIFGWKRVDFCEFLTEFKMNVLMQIFFKKSMQLSDFIVCPIRVGNYTINNIGVAENVNPENLRKGTYKFFVEIVEGTGEFAKIFAMQVTSIMYCC